MSTEKDNIIIGIDTSCYTTSIAAISLNGKIIFSKKIMLKVKPNEKGLRQSEGVFQHINNLGNLFNDKKMCLSNFNIKAVCVSTKPRPVENSYMPVFMAGYNFAKAITSSLNIPLYETTHQENHIEASYYTTDIKRNKFLSIHMSGGTTEILLVEKKSDNYNIEIVGGSKDISFGQLIDRIGVNLGYNFPCGKYLDEKALKCNEKINIGLKTSVKEGYMNISGLENQINKLINKYEEEYICKLTLDSLVKNIYKSVVYISDKYEIYDIVFAGGVASSKYIRLNIEEKLKKHNMRCYFTNPDYSADNAVGCAIIGLNKFIGEK